MYDTIIIGSGPAGLAAGIYTSQNKLKTLVLSKEELEYGHIKGPGLLSLEALKTEFNNQLKHNTEFLEFQNKKEVVSLEKNIVSFALEVKSGALFYSKTVIIACGSENTEFDLVTHKNISGKIKINANMETNIPGIFAAGDATLSSKNDLFTSAGQGAKAALSAVAFCRKVL